MEHVSWKLCVLMLAGWLGLCTMGRSQCAAQQGFPSMLGQVGSLAKKPSIGESISSGFKRSVEKLTEAFQPKRSVKSADDPVSVFSKAKPTAETYVAVGRLYEQTGKLDQAADLYRQALAHETDHVGGLLGLARVKARAGKPDEAMKLYLRAVKAHPGDASVHNDVGIFYSSRGMFDEAIGALQQAIRLQPKQANYRANMAVVLVRMGRTQDALLHLRAVHSEAAANYNVGFLLKQEGQPEAAARHFAAALQIDPSLNEARYWLKRLEEAHVQARTPIARPESGLRVSRLPARPAGGQGSGPVRPPASAARSWPPGPSLPRRLPPTRNGPATGLTPAPVPAGSYDQSMIPTAPLPPGATDAPPIQLPPRAN